MGRMTIKKFVNCLNNEEENGGYWLPNIQRPFIWKEEQIERLYDSILRDYPVGSLLLWQTKDNVYIRKFIDIFSQNLNLKNYTKKSNKNQKKVIVLDGQQRLQSLFIGLKGSYCEKELYFNIESGNEPDRNDMIYLFKFIEPAKAEYPFVKLKDIVFSYQNQREIKENISNTVRNNGDIEEQDKKISDRISDNVDLILNLFSIKDKIVYNTVDSVDNPKLYTHDDIVEIFIRANSGGTQLEKSDLLFSLLIAKWDKAQESIDDLIKTLNRTGYKFDRDFILKVCLVLINKGAKYKIEKFRNEGNKKLIEDNWEKISDSILYVKDFIYGKTYLKTDKTLPSYASLIPLIYSRYHYDSDIKTDSQYSEYLLDVNLTGVFGGMSASFTDALIKNIRNNKKFDKPSIYNLIKNKGKSMAIYADTLLNMHYGSDEIHLLFNMWYGFNYEPTFGDNKPQIDHIFPVSVLRNEKSPNPTTGVKNITKYKKNDRNQIANLMLLSAVENMNGGKGDKLPEEWFKDKDEEYLDLHLIPKDKDLWKV